MKGEGADTGLDCLITWESSSADIGDMSVTSVGGGAGIQVVSENGGE